MNDLVNSIQENLDLREALERERENMRALQERTTNEINNLRRGQ